MPGRLLIRVGDQEVPFFGSGLPRPAPLGVTTRMLNPIDGAVVTGDIYLEALIAPALGATAVKFQVAHPDFGYYPAVQVGQSNVWRSVDPWKSALSPSNRSNALPNDFAAYIRPVITTGSGVIEPPLIEVITNNLNITGQTPTWRPALEFTSKVDGTIAEFYASFDQKHGTSNNPDGTPPAVLVPDTSWPGGRYVAVTVPDGHTTADQPNSGLRWQVQTPPIQRDGDVCWIGYTIRTPLGFPTPKSSHISIGQDMGADSTGSYDRGLRLMMHARTKTSTEGYTDQIADHWLINMSDGRYGEPGLTFRIPFRRGEKIDLIFGLGYSKDPRRGWLEIMYRLEGGTLTRHEFFGIPGKYRIPVALIDPDGVGQRWDQHIYRSRGKFASVSMQFGQLKIRSTAAEADPHSNG